jgi:hypothetical protein
MRRELVAVRLAVTTIHNSSTLPTTLPAVVGADSSVAEADAAEAMEAAAMEEAATAAIMAAATAAATMEEAMAMAVATAVATMEEAMVVMAAAVATILGEMETPKAGAWTRRQVHQPDLWHLRPRCPALLLTLQSRDSA